MSPNNEQLNFGDIVSLLHRELAAEGYTITKFYEEELNLPIDLWCTREIDEKPEYCLVLVASLDHISDDFQRMLMFYQYYISYDYKPSEYKIILAVPAGATVEHIPYYADSEVEKAKDFYKENGFGLWKISEQSIDRETYSPMPLWDKITKDYVDGIAKNNKKLLRIQDTVTGFVDKYIHDAVLGIRGPIIKGREAIKLEERHIDSQLLQKILKLKNISYRNYLYLKITEHLSYKGYKGDEYDFVRDVFSQLWKDSIGISFKDFLEKFDPALRHVFAGNEADKKAYRDHYIHQFQVFLSGLIIMDILYDDFLSKYKEPEICWLITSSFHDMAYPVQKYDEWSDEFFKDIFNVGEMGRLELQSKFIDNSFLTCVSRLLTRLCSVFLGEDLTAGWYATKSNLIKCLYQEITESKNHSILSSVSLLKMVEEQYSSEIHLNGLELDDILDKIIVPSALSIAIHDKYFWRKLKDEEKWQSQGERCPLPLLKYETDPLTFLLIFCDVIQEWGRPYKSDEEFAEERKEYFYLKEFAYDPSNREFNITLWSPKHKRGERFFTFKEDELKEIKSFIQQPSHAKFNIRVEDRDGNGESYPMGGPM